MRLNVRDFDLRVLNMRARMPFRYGIASLEALPHLLVQVNLEIDGTTGSGIAADGLPPKWFTKDPSTSFRDDLEQMRAVIDNACRLAVEVKDSPTVFDWWRQVYDAQSEWGAAKGLAPLLSGFGVSLVERGVIDAFCKLQSTTFARAIRDGSFGFHPGNIHGELAGTTARQFLPERPLRSVIARHTVGLSDPLSDADIPPAERVDDGLPQSLEACIRAYGLTHFKIKLCGDEQKDLPRMRELARIIGAEVRGNVAFTLDGNEQFQSVAAFQDAWRSLLAEPLLATFMDGLLFVEQPFHRNVALSDSVAPELQAWEDRPPMIIDESDGSLDSLPTALLSGYSGTSHKNCKGIFKGVANACLIAQRSKSESAGQFVLSGEDLANVGPIALLSDLAVAANLGITHVERNGHHYFRGLSMYAQAIQEAVLKRHPDLYHRHPAGFATLRIENGRIDLGSVVDAPFGYSAPWDSSAFESWRDWTFDSLQQQR